MRYPLSLLTCLGLIVAPLTAAHPQADPDPLTTDEAAPAPHLGTWHVRVADDRPVPADATMTLTFDPDGTLAFAGFPGNPTGTWTLDPEDPATLHMTVTHAGSSMDSAMRLAHAGDTLHLTKLPAETVSVLTRAADTTVPRLDFQRPEQVVPAGAPLTNRAQLIGTWRIRVEGGLPIEDAEKTISFNDDGTMSFGPIDPRIHPNRLPNIRWILDSGTLTMASNNLERRASITMDVDGVLYMLQEFSGLVVLSRPDHTPQWIDRLADPNP